MLLSHTGKGLLGEQPLNTLFQELHRTGVNTEGIRGNSLVLFSGKHNNARGPNNVLNHILCINKKEFSVTKILKREIKIQRKEKNKQYNCFVLRCWDKWRTIAASSQAWTTGSPRHQTVDSWLSCLSSGYASILHYLGSHWKRTSLYPELKTWVAHPKYAF